jgi:glycosyltransferase 2 family protein
MTSNRIIHIGTFKKIFTILFFLLIIFFLVIYFRKADFSNIKNIWPNEYFLLISFILGLSYRFWSSFIWMCLLKLLGARIRFSRQLFYLYAKSWLGRYIPGKVFWILGRIYFASKCGISKTKLLISSTIEVSSQIQAFLLLSFIMLLLSGNIGLLNSNVRFLIGIAAALLALMLFPQIFNYAAKSGYKIFKKQEFDKDNYINLSLLFKMFSLSGFGFILSGMTYYFFVWAFVPSLHFDHMPYILGAFNLAGVIGTLAVFAPSGLGVREGVQLLFLYFIIPKETAILIVALARLWSTALDLVFFLINWLINLGDHTAYMPGSQDR